MDGKKEKLSLSNYVIFKNANECLEGRISGLPSSSTSDVFNIFCFNTFTEFKVPITEIVCNVSQEVKRKMKSSPFFEIPNKTHFPPGLKNVLIVDKEWSQENMYDLPHKTNVLVVLKNFRDFLMAYSGIADSDEVGEVIKGFTMCFNTFFKKFLIYEGEKSQIMSLKGEPSEYCGPLHLLRLLYFLQKETGNYVSDLSTKCIVLDYTVYLLDFLLMKYKDYF